jgi:hypothetical protein
LANRQQAWDVILTETGPFADRCCRPKDNDSDHIGRVVSEKRLAPTQAVISISKIYCRPKSAGRQTLFGRIPDFLVESRSVPIKMAADEDAVRFAAGKVVA